MHLESLYEIGLLLGYLFTFHPVDAAASFIMSESSMSPSRKGHFGTNTKNNENESKNGAKRVACIGNSIQYFNDCPRLLENISNGNISNQDSCLRGGVSLINILKQGNGMRNKFRTANAIIKDESEQCKTVKYDIGAPSVQTLLCGENHCDEKNEEENSGLSWDFIIMNDHTQSLARLSSRRETIQTLCSDYVPMIRQCGGIPILLMTAAYRREGIMDSDDLGTFEEFSEKVEKGYIELANALSEVLPTLQRPRIAPVGMAYKQIYFEDKKQWERLYHDDHFHPSPHGTFLQACVLHFTIFGYIPDEKEILLQIEREKVDSSEGGIWLRARMMEPKGDRVQSRPDKDEALYLLDVAKRVCMEYNSNLDRPSK
mmetsp:Transcript_22658/g.27788  ORF Transcript_22658/g.27788 Transcript_22658/m.27788 type:complete len:372 (-) Transcript_22658:60-1175(-)